MKKKVKIKGQEGQAATNAAKKFQIVSCKKIERLFGFVFIYVLYLFSANDLLS